MYKSVPMGLSVAPAAMLKVLLQVFSGKNTRIGLYTYMDDILLVAPTGKRIWVTFRVC